MLVSFNLQPLREMWGFKFTYFGSNSLVARIEAIQCLEVLHKILHSIEIWLRYSGAMDYA